jgi:Xaa-Pro aminopeptidase
METREPDWNARLMAPFLVFALTLSCGGEDSKPLAPPSPEPPPGSTYSLASFREAGRVTAVGAREAMRTARSGQTEAIVKGLIDGAFRAEGSTELAFPHIVAAGGNAVLLHYAGNDSVLRDGELLLIDIGAASGEICSDCSRTFPVRAAFNPRQRELYQLVLEVHRRVVESARPGLDSLSGLGVQARRLFRDSSLRARDENGELRSMDHFFTHSLGHYVGRRVHGEDTGWIPFDPLQPGQVLTIEPGLYIATEGIGIRIEDTYLVTATGLECLTGGCPKDVAEIEALRSTAPLLDVTSTVNTPLPVRPGALAGYHLVPRDSPDP